MLLTADLRAKIADVGMALMLLHVRGRQNTKKIKQ